MKAEEFIRRIQDYFGGKYTATQLEEVTRWAVKLPERALHLVYRYVTLNEDTRFGRPPTIKVLNANMAEIYDAYPELRVGSHNQIGGNLMIEERQPDQEEVQQFMTGLVQTMKRGVHPAEFYEEWEKRSGEADND